jgi:hypothetical protein
VPFDSLLGRDQYLTLIDGLVAAQGVPCVVSSQHCDLIPFNAQLAKCLDKLSDLCAASHAVDCADVLMRL